MAAEIAEIPVVLERQVDTGLPIYLETGERLRGMSVHGFVTGARGTSGQAATFFKYVFETATGLPVTPIGPSVASIYHAKLNLGGFAALSFSQSGGSPDLVALQQAAGEGGAHTIAVLNVTDSPLGAGAGSVVPVFAGPEAAVASTKSFVGMLFASLAILAGYQGDQALESRLRMLPDMARRALDSDWTTAADRIARSSSIFCIGRGPSLAVAGEAALKIKETCQLHAEAFSAAEFMHGPVALAGPGLTALTFGSGSLADASIRHAECRMRSQEMTVFSAGMSNGPGGLPAPGGNHEFLDPVLQVIAFYRFVEDLAVSTGHDPDTPRGLTKVTKTV